MRCARERAQRVLARSSVSSCAHAVVPFGCSCLRASRSWSKSSPTPRRSRYGASVASLGGMRLATAARVPAQATPPPADKPSAGVASASSCPTAYPQRRRGCVWDLRGVAQAPAAEVLAAPTRAATTAAVQVFARALIRPAPRTRRRFPQLPEAGAIALTPYLGAVHSLDDLYRNNSPLLSVALANDQTGLTVTGTGVYSMGGTGATQIGYGCTMVQRSVGAFVRYVVVSKSNVDLLSSNTCSKTTHPASLRWTCLAGSDHTGQPVNVRIVGTRKPNEATTHTRAIGAIAQDPTKPDRL